jgi:hypothetical protein
MAALLELLEVRERLSRLSVEEYHRLDDVLACAHLPSLRIALSQLFAT